MVKLIVVDDDPFIRESLKLIIAQDPEMEVIGTCTNGEEAHRFCLEHPEVELALMDIRMPGCDGVEGAGRIKRDAPHVRILILTTFDDDEYIVEALKRGVSGYLLKNLPPDRIIEGIKTVMQGHMLVHPDVAKKLPGFLQQGSKKPKDLARYGITVTEQQVIECIAEGLSNKEISEKLYLSEGTVKNYVTQILQKLALRDRTQIAIFYLKNQG
jgi:DNA-binding NarL/FixJ family response regulator